jgi:competence protein ComEC
MEHLPPWKIWPFLRILPALIAGIWLQHYYPHKILLPITMGIGCVCMLAILIRLPIGYRYRFRKLQGLFIYLAIFSMGSFITHQSTITNDRNWIGHHYQTGDTLILQIQTEAEERSRSIRYTAYIYALQQNHQYSPQQGTILLYTPKDLPHFTPGTWIQTHATLTPIKSNGNPGAFDYAAYCAFRGIHHQLFIQDDQHYIIQQGKAGKSILATARDYIIQTCERFIQHEQEQGIVMALLIGHKALIDEALMEAYSRTGVIHVIAISGMHLAMVYSLLLLLMKPLQRTRSGRIISTLFVLLAIWAFTLLTGAGPSVLRATVICTSLCLGKILQEEGHGLNSLAASAACLLIYDPFYLWDIGFQLSFTAVAGILLFAGPIYRSCFFRYAWLRYLWQGMSVTLAAQVFTLPVILFHFHQFPNLFLLTNLIVVPISGILLYAAIVLLSVSPITWLATLTGKFVSLVCTCMNALIQYLSAFNFAATDHIHLNTLQVILYLLMVIAFIYYTRHQKIVWLYTGLLLIMGMGCIRWQWLSNRYRQQQLVVYQVPGKTAIDLIGGTDYVFWGDTNSLAQTDRYLRNSRSITGAWQRKGVIPVAGNSYWQRGKWQVHYITEKTPDTLFPATHQYIVILGQGANNSLPLLNQLFPNALYLFDSSNPLWKIEKWKKEADSLHLRHHSVPRQGAFLMDL